MGCWDGLTRRINVAFNATMAVVIQGVFGGAPQVLRDPAGEMWNAMLGGWARQQRARCLRAVTITQRTRVVRRFYEFSNQYPWEWTAAEFEAFITSLGGLRPSTTRGYQASIRSFLDYVVSPEYDWVARCEEELGAVPRQVVSEWNSYTHNSTYEGAPGRRPLTYDEVQRLFDAADGLVETIRTHGRKGALAAQRDAAVLKMIYAFGLRRQEAWGLDIADLHGNSKVPAYGRLGTLFVRWGKSSRGGPAKRRSVLLVPEMDWVIDPIEQWLADIRPSFGPLSHPALFLSERGARLSMRSINRAFQDARSAASLPTDLDLHSLRHSYVTHLIEFDYPERFVQDQVGHQYAATTAIYAGVSDDYRHRIMQRVLERDRDRWDVGP